MNTGASLRQQGHDVSRGLIVVIVGNIDRLREIEICFFQQLLGLGNILGNIGNVGVVLKGVGVHQRSGIDGLAAIEAGDGLLIDQQIESLTHFLLHQVGLHVAISTLIEVEHEAAYIVRVHRERLGAALGCVSGYYGGKVDSVLVSVQEMFSIFPGTLINMLCIGFMGKSVRNLLLIFTFTGWPGVMRIVRGRILSLKQEPYVESCRANGIGGMSIMFRHLLPNTLGPIIVNSTMNVAGYILSEAALSYLGLGVPDNVPTWGNIINAAKRLDIVQTMPMLWLAPAAAICLFVLSINFFGDAQTG